MSVSTLMHTSWTRRICGQILFESFAKLGPVPLATEYILIPNSPVKKGDVFFLNERLGTKWQRWKRVIYQRYAVSAPRNQYARIGPSASEVVAGNAAELSGSIQPGRCSQREGLPCILEDQNRVKIAKFGCLSFPYRWTDPRSLIDMHLLPHFVPLTIRKYDHKNSQNGVEPYANSGKHSYRALYILPAAVLFVFSAALIAYGLFCCPTRMGVSIVLLAGIPVYGFIWCIVRIFSLPF